MIKRIFNKKTCYVRFTNLLVIILLFIGAQFIQGCTEIIDFDLKDGKINKVVVEGGITTEKKSHMIKLTKSANYYLNRQADKVQGAKVSITCENETYNLKESEPGIYLTDKNVEGQIGKTYTLNIEVGNEHYEAKETINRLVPLDSITFKYFDQPYTIYSHGEEKTSIGYYKIFFFGQEPSSLGNKVGDFYLWDLYINDKIQTDSLREKVFESDELVDNNYIHDWDIFWIPESDLSGDSSLITVKMQSISKGYYDYIIAAMLETTWKGSPFDGPPANVPCNITNGGLGYFTATAVASKSIWIHKP